MTSAAEQKGPAKNNTRGTKRGTITCKISYSKAKSTGEKREGAREKVTPLATQGKAKGRGTKEKPPAKGGIGSPRSGATK